MRRCATGSSDPVGTYYLLGSAVGGHPYPYIVRELQAVIGREARAQMLERTGALPDAVIACVGGGSNAIGLFHAFLADRSVEIIGIEAGGRGGALGENAATLVHGRPGVLHGSYSMLLQDEDGQIQETHSISAGLDYPGVGPEHALLHADRPRALRVRQTTRRRSRRCASAASWREFCRRSRALTRSRVRALGRQASGPARADRPLRARRQGHADAVGAVARA